MVLENSLYLFGIRVSLITKAFFNVLQRMKKKETLIVLPVLCFPLHSN